ncbi:endoplasmic reticulum-derived transport vesicle ERV46 [Laetiporus sulphureus 93-53]|uniref:Endoplasmic reticulum-derived transport vesicle ERV46 n=1 Tax=Laetiporus sulphureus 93-53 TaxID=1314785 RepID=A0A165FPD9_9APHY|nr:endoplasmic reticulum-derived transport vesicle ERV46 [Laetiporus sulphureus 93-53]KZT09274.1 endoplasmic reticulum-derived transport vesicle ERV46 [Laetiporus sulphureus 93-53]
MPGKGLFGSLKGIDAFGKTMEDVKVKTRTGAFLTLISAAIILAFTTMEFFDYRRVYVDTSIVVDRSRGEKLNLRMNVTFPRVPCYLLSLDVMDISGETQSDISHNILKKRIGKNGEPMSGLNTPTDLQNDLDKLNTARGPDYCGSCFGGQPPESGCCNTCDQVRQAYVDRGWSFNRPESIEQCVSEGWSDKLKEQADEGCNISGKVRVNKVVGNIHLSPGRSFRSASQNIYDLVPYLRDDNNRHDFSHTIHEFAFESDQERRTKLPMQVKEKMGTEGNPLDGTVKKTSKQQYMFQYFLKVVSTQFNTLQGKSYKTHQYSATHFERDLTKGHQEDNKEGVHVAHTSTGIPGAFFNYDISPILIVHTETRQSFAHFLTSTCAIVGGVLTIASLLDSVLFATTRALKHRGGAHGYGNGKLM